MYAEMPQIAEMAVEAQMQLLALLSKALLLSTLVLFAATLGQYLWLCLYERTPPGGPKPNESKQALRR